MQQSAAKTLLATAMQPRHFVVALVVGSCLNLINQGEALIAGLPLDFWKLGLTFLTPFLVSTYSSYISNTAALRSD